MTRPFEEGDPGRPGARKPLSLLPSSTLPLAMVLGFLLCRVPAEVSNAPLYRTLSAACMAGTHLLTHKDTHAQRALSTGRTNELL